MEELEVEKKDYATIQLKPRGPVTITGNFEVIMEDGTILEKREKEMFHAERQRTQRKMR